jgi:transposase-like protein
LNWNDRRFIKWLKTATDDEIRSFDIVRQDLGINCLECGTPDNVYFFDGGSEFIHYLCFDCAKKYQAKELNSGSHKGNGLRFRVLARDKFRCVYCGRSAKEDGVVLEVDHVYPKSKGGEDTMDNLVTACRDCNQGKKDMVLG